MTAPSRPIHAAAVLCFPYPPSAGIGDLASLTDDASGSCGGAGVPDRVYVFDIPVDGSQLFVATDEGSTTSDTLLYVRTACDDTASEIVCDAAGGEGVFARFASIRCRSSRSTCSSTASRA